MINDETNSEYLNTVVGCRYLELYNLDDISLKSQQNMITYKYYPVFSKTYYYNNAYNILLGYFKSGTDFYLKSLSLNDNMWSDMVELFSGNNIAPFFQAKNCSCFITQFINILCFAMTSDNSNNLLLYAYDAYLTKKDNINLGYTLDPNQQYYINCIHLKKEIGVFIFYKIYQNSLYPFIFFKQYDQEIQKIANYTLPEILLEQTNFEPQRLLNDFIKIEEDKLCFISTKGNKEELYIVLINLINDINIAIRYYSIEIFSNYHFKFFKNLKIHNYNNMIAFAFSYCKQDNCDSNDDTYYSSFLVFSNPNGTDYY